MLLTRQIDIKRLKEYYEIVGESRPLSGFGLGSESPRTHLSTCDDLDLTHLNVRRS